MTYRQHEIRVIAGTAEIWAGGKKLDTALSEKLAMEKIDRRWAAFPTKPLGWW